MTDELDDAARERLERFHEAARRLSEESVSKSVREAAPTDTQLRRDFEIWRESLPPKPKPKLDIAPAPTEKWLDALADVVDQTNDTLAQMVDQTNKAVDELDNEFEKLGDRVRELMVERAADRKAREDEREARESIEDRLDRVEDRERENMVAIARLEAANAKLELELVRATAGNQRGMLDHSSMKVIN